MGTDDAGSGRAAGREALRLAVLLALVGAMAPAPAFAVEVDGFVELTGASSTQKTEIGSDFSRELKGSNFFQRYSVNANWLLYPHLRFAVGGLFERDDSLDRETLTGFDVTQETLRPYVNMTIGHDIFSADMGFYRLQNRFAIGDVSAREIRDTWNATLNWRPLDLPQWTLYIVRNDLHDARRESLDSLDTLYDLQMDWTPIDSLNVRYRGGRQDNEDHIQDVEFGLISHFGRLTYGDTFFDRRLLVSAEYNVNYQKRDVASDGSGEAVVPVFPAAGLSANDDFPDTVTLSANPALTDGDRTTSAGINLGLPGPGGDTSLRNIGLDLTIPVRVDALRLWVTPVLPANVAAAFDWQVYSSTDNQVWTLEGTAAAVFVSLDSRFDLSLPEITSRYLKVVTAPLDGTDPDASQFPLILVTELGAFDRTPAEDAPASVGLTTQRLNANARVKLLPNESFYYDLSYFGVWPEMATSTNSLSNALSYSKQINPILGVSARAARESGKDPVGHFVSYPYTASVRAGWLPTLRQSLVFSGVNTDYDQVDTRFASLYLQTSAELYRGISLELGLGQSRRNTAGDRVDSDQVTASLFFLPHPALTLTLLYQRRHANRPPDTIVGSTAGHFQAEEVTLSYRPFPAIYLYGSYRLEHQEDQPDRTYVDYNFSWSPFPSGSLQITLRYDESYRSQLDTSSGISSATVRWNLPRGRWIEGGYVRQTLETSLDRRQFDSLQANLRWTF